MIHTLYRSVASTLLLLILLCGIYPALVTLIGQGLFPSQSLGGLLHQEGKPIGSHLIGQAFTQPKYFHGRPSAAGTGYDAANSSGSNLGPTNQKFHDTLKANIEALLKENPTLKSGAIPNDLVTTSASGLDPHISPSGALAQVERVSQARHLAPEAVKSLIQKHTQGPELGLFGETVVNVLELNLALDAIDGASPTHL